MQIKYITQVHQTKAISSIADIFLGQSKQVCEYDIFDGDRMVLVRFGRSYGRAEPLVEHQMLSYLADISNLVCQDSAIIHK